MPANRDKKEPARLSGFFVYAVGSVLSVAVVAVTAGVVLASAVAFAAGMQVPVIMASADTEQITAFLARL